MQNPIVRAVAEIGDKMEEAINGVANKPHCIISQAAVNYVTLFRPISGSYFYKIEA